MKQISTVLGLTLSGLFGRIITNFPIIILSKIHLSVPRG